MASTNYINECKNRVNHNRLGKIIVNGINTPITNSDNLQKIEINSGCYIDGSIIGSVYIKKLNGEFIALNENLTDKTIEAQIGVKYANNSTEYMKMGKYIVEKPKTEITANMKQITAYSIISDKLENTYVCNINYEQGNKTLKDLYIDVCNQLGLTPTSTTFDNCNIPIIANPFTNKETNKVVLQTVAKIACTWVEINDDTNKIELCWLSTNNNPDYTFEKSDYSEVEGGDITLGPINCVVIKNSQIDDENYTKQEGAGDKKIVISEDYILYNEPLRIQAMTAIWEKLHNLTYTNVKLTTYYGKPFLKIGSKIRVMTGENTYIDAYVLMHTFTYDGTFTSVIESPVLTDQEIKTKQTTIFDNIKNTQVIVDKQNQQIQALITNVEENNEKIDALQPTEEATGIEEMYLPKSAGKDLIEFKLKGKSKQDSYTGKNLFNNAYGQTSNVYTININANNPLGSVNCYPINLLPNTQYTLKVDMNGYQKTGAWIAGICFENGDVISLLQLGSIEDITTKTFTTDSTGVVYVGHRYGFTYGTTGRMDLFLQTAKIQIEKGSTATEYEPYVGGTASPNPDYPQDINSIGDVRNLFDKDNANILNDVYIATSQNKLSTTTGTKTLYISIKGGETYTISKTISQRFAVATTEIIPQAQVSLIDKSQNNLASSITIATSSNANYLCVFYLHSSDTKTEQEILDSIQIEKSSTATDYIPHGNYIDVVNRGKNLLKNTLLTEERTTNGMTVTPQPDGSLIFNGTTTANTYFNITNNVDFGDVSFNSLNNASDKYIANTSNTKFSLSYDKKGVVYIYVLNDRTYNNEIVYPMIRKITVEDNTYEPYIEPIHNYINLTQTLSSLPNGTADELIVKDGKAKIIQNIKKIILDGSESNWASNQTATDGTLVNRINIDDYLRIRQNICYCNYFASVINGGYSSLTYGKCNFRYTSGDTSKYLYFGSNMTLNDFKTWLGEKNNEGKPLIIQYELTEPIEIDLGEVSIKTINGDDYLYIIDPIKSDMYAKYIRQTNYNDIYYTKHETDTQINIAKDSITSSVSETYETKLDASTSINNAKNEAISRANSYSDDILNTARTESTLYTNQKVSEEITATSERITVVEEAIRDGVSVVRTETGYTFDADGLKIAKEGQEMNSLLDNDGLSVKRNTDEVLTVRSEGVSAENITVRNYFKLDPVRFEKISSTTDSTQDGLGIFYTGGDN